MVQFLLDDNEIDIDDLGDEGLVANASDCNYPFFPFIISTTSSCFVLGGGLTWVGVGFRI